MNKRIGLLFFLFLLFTVVSMSNVSADIIFSSNSTTINTSSEYTVGKAYGFQVTITDTVTASNINETKVYFEHNFDGTVRNISASNTTETVFTFNLTAYNYTGGTFNIKWYARNNSVTGGSNTGTWNSSADMSITYKIATNTTGTGIDQKITTFTQGATRTESDNANIQGIQGQGASFANCTMKVSNEGTASLFRDNAAWTQNSGTSLAIGSYTVKCNATGNANFSSNSTGCSYTLSIIASGGGGGGGYYVPLQEVTETTQPEEPSPIIEIPEIDPKIIVILIIIIVVLAGSKKK